MILALETATDVCSVAFEDTTGTTYEKRSKEHGSHSENLFLFIQELMNEHAFSIKDIDAVLVSEGPGSYTGLRIAASGLKGLLFGTKVSLCKISTLASFAIAGYHHFSEPIHIHAIIDARRKHIYHQSFLINDDRMTAESKVCIMPIKEFEQTVQPDDLIIGTGLDRLDKQVMAGVRMLDSDFISARSLIRLFHRTHTNEFVKKVPPQGFDPSYYSSYQINS